MIVTLVILILLILENWMALSLLLLLTGGTLMLYDRFFRKKVGHYGILRNEGVQKMITGIHEGLEGLKRN